MLMFRKFYVKKDERALLFSRGDFVEILRPGENAAYAPVSETGFLRVRIPGGAPDFFAEALALPPLFYNLDVAINVPAARGELPLRSRVARRDDSVPVV